MTPNKTEREDPDAGPPLVRAKRPLWLPHFFGRVPLGLDPKYLQLIGVVALAGAFENFDQSVLTAALKQIRESFSLGQAEASSLFAWIRLGAVPAFLVVPFADRVGRRRIFLISIIGMSLGTLASGFAPTAILFVVAQTLTRTFIVSCIACAVVIIAEELPSEHRGWGIGILGAVGSLGYGLGALLYAFVEVLPFGWRSLYMVGGIPLLFIPMFRRKIVETKRFSEHQAEKLAGGIATGLLDPLRELLKTYPGRSIAVAALALCYSIGATPAFGLLSDFVQTSHGWSPARYSTMAIVAGAFGIIGNPAMGWAADRFGRKPVASLSFIGFPIAAAGLYFGPAEMIPFMWIPFIFLLTGSNVLLRIIASELFPTSSRNTAMGWETLMETVGAAAGYALVGALTASDASIAPAAVGVSLLTLLGVLVVFFLPETAGRDLEETSRNASASETVSG